MSQRDLLQEPIWSDAELGVSIPPGKHGISVALPCWRHVVGYEENDPAVVSRLAGGYPRFVIHREVQELARAICPEGPCLPFPSERTARRCVEFIKKATGEAATIHPSNGVFAVATSDAAKGSLKAFWQHTGLIVSTRQAEAALAGRHPTPNHEVREALRQQLADLYDCEPGDVFLTPTGMAAQFEALQAVCARAPGLPTVQLGFPYVDTLKLQQKMGVGGLLLHDLDTITADLERLLAEKRVAGCFGEIPGNPLLGSADLGLISPILRRHGVPLVADDVVATPFNVDLSPYADLIATSLTKFITGSGEVMGGALICNPRSPFYAELKSRVKAQHEELLWDGDAEVLNEQARGFRERMARHNAGGLWIAEQLRKHPAVDRVWYPKWEFTGAYERVRRPEGGWGALITFLPRDAESRSSAIFDRLEICKGPSLGTIYSLACPFTLLAHYAELDWAEACGVSRFLIRVSVGLEDPKDLWQRFERALSPRA
jgi:cystathionine gamma-synthase